MVAPQSNKLQPFPASCLWGALCEAIARGFCLGGSFVQLTMSTQLPLSGHKSQQPDESMPRSLCCVKTCPTPRHFTGCAVMQQCGIRLTQSAAFFTCKLAHFLPTAMPFLLKSCKRAFHSVQTERSVLRATACSMGRSSTSLPWCGSHLAVHVMVTLNECRHIEVTHLPTNMCHIFGCYAWINKRAGFQRMLQLQQALNPPLYPPLTLSRTHAAHEVSAWQPATFSWAAGSTLH